MYFIGVWLLLNELCSFFIYAELMASKFRVVRKIENALSDIEFLEECTRKKQIPKGFKWKFRAQGLKEEDERKVEQIKKDAVLRIIDVVIKGLKEKEKELNMEEEKMVNEAWDEKEGWDRIKWMERLDGFHKRYKEEAKMRKGKKLKQMGKVGLEEAANEEETQQAVWEEEEEEEE